MKAKRQQKQIDEAGVAIILRVGLFRSGRKQGTCIGYRIPMMQCK
jgi:hypothetical protein